MTENLNHRLHATLSGRVQGVGFRYYVLQLAQEAQITGWVRNLKDGRVEVLAEGTLSALNQLLARLRTGPISAEVTEVDYNYAEATGEFDRFRVRPGG